MKKHTSDFKEEIKKLGKQQTARITYILNGKTVVLGSEDINSATPNTNGDLLKSVMKELDLDSNIDIEKDTKIKFEYGLLINGEYEYIDYGNYFVYSSEKQEDTLSYKIKCYDKLINTMKDYEETGVSYPCTIKEFLSALCIKCNLRMKEGLHFANENRILTRDLFKEQGYKYRDVFDQISQVAGGTICLTLDDEVEVRYVNKLINTETNEKSDQIQFNSDVEENIKFDKLYSSHSQKTTEGRNLFNPKATTTTTNGVTVSQEGKYRIKINGKNTYAHAFNFDEILSLEKDEYYTVTIKKVSGSCTTYAPSKTWGFLFYPDGDASDSPGRLAFLPSDTVRSWTFKSVASNRKPFIWFGWENESVVGTNGVFTNLIIEISIVKGKTALDYEDYTGGQPSPSLDYPQEVKTVGNNINFLDYTAIIEETKGLKSTLNQDDSITTSGIPLENYVRITNIQDYTNDLEDGETYTIYTETSLYSSLYVQGRLTKADGSVVYVSNNTGNIKTFKVDKETYKKYEFWVQSGLLSSWGTDSKTITSKYMLRKGTEVTPFSRYNQGSVEIVKRNQNFLNLPEKTTTSEGITSTFKDGVFNLKGTLKQTYSVIYPRTNYNLKAGTYTAKAINLDKEIEVRMVLEDGTTRSFWLIAPASKSTVTFQQNITAIFIVYHHANIGDVVDLSISLQIEEGTVASDFVPPQSETYTLPVQQEMLEGDYIDNVEHHEWGKIVLTGSEENIGRYKGAKGQYFWGIPTDLKAISPQDINIEDIFCNMAVKSSRSKIYSGVVSDSLSYGSSDYYYRDIAIYFEETSSMSITNFKSFLKEKYDAGNPVIIYYKLAEPYDLELTDEQKNAINKFNNTKSYLSGNNILLTDELGKLQVTYPIDYDTVDEEYFKDINVNFGEKYGPVNSIVLSRSESDNIYIKDDESIEKNGLCELKIQENQIMNFNDRSDYLKELSEKLFGLEYYINDFSSTGILIYDIMDMYNVKIDGKNYNCLLLNDEVNITQGLEESIYTEMPETSVTDYSKADKTDRKINQTNLIVDKQNQEIQGVISQIGDRSEKTTTITADINELNSKVSHIEDFTSDTVNGLKTITLTNCHAGDLLELHIYGNNNVFGFLAPSDDLYPADTLYPKGDSLITVENGSKIDEYELGILDVLRRKETVYDEYELKDGQAKVIRRINKDGTVREKELAEDLSAFNIKLYDGSNTITIKNYSADLSVKYAFKNNYSETFATKTYVDSSIEQTENSITTSVNEKFENYSTTSEINSLIKQTADEITQKVQEVETITKTATGTKFINIESAMEGQLVELHIYGNNEVFGILAPSDTLYPSNTLYPQGDSVIIVTDSNNNSVEYELGITDKLRANGQTKDEFILKDNRAKVIRRVDKNGVILEEEQTENLGRFYINLTEGNNKITIKNYSADMECTFVYSNNFTDVFTTKVDMNAQIRLTQKEFEVAIAEETDGESLISKINLNKTDATIEAKNINLNGIITANGNFKILEDGSMEANNGTFSGDIYIGKNKQLVSMSKGIMSSLYSSSEGPMAGGYDYLGYTTFTSAQYVFVRNALIVQIYIPENFSILEANLIIEQISPSFDALGVTGKAKNIKLYKGMAEPSINYIDFSERGSGFFSFSNMSGIDVTEVAFGKAMIEPQIGITKSNNIANILKAGELNSLYLATTISDYDQKSASQVEAKYPAQITGLAKVYLQAIGYVNPFANEN